MKRKLITSIVSLLTLSCLVGCGDKGPKDLKYTAPVANDGLVYDGQSKKLITEGFTEHGTFYYALNDGEYSLEAPSATDAGDYLVKWYIAADKGYIPVGTSTNYYEINVNVAKIAITEEMYVAPLINDEVDPSISPDLVIGGSSEVGTFYYSIDGNNYSPAIPTCNTKGDFVVNWYLKGDVNHFDVGSKEEPKIVRVHVEKGPIMSERLNFGDIEYHFENDRGDSKLTSDDKTISLNYADLIDRDNNAYYKDFCSLGLLLSGELYDWLYPKIKVGDEYVDAEIIDYLGVQDKRMIDTSTIKLTDDFDDIAICEAAHYDFKYKNEYRQVFFLSFQGTKYDREWYSNFDLGANNKDYLKTEDEHEDWKNRDHHKGFDVAANRAIEEIDKYLGACQRVDNPILFISGHSRGGSISNIVGAHYSDIETYKTYCYTFASPAAVSNVNRKEYKNIFNILNDDDVVACAVNENNGFYLYGTSYHGKASDHQEKIEDYLNSEYTFFGSIVEVKEIIDGIFPNREAVYAFPEDFNDEYAYDFFDTEEEVIEIIEELKETAEEAGVIDYLLFSDPYYNEEEDWFEYRWKYKPAILLGCISYILEHQGGELEDILTYALNVLQFLPGLAIEVVPYLLEGMMSGTMEMFIGPHTPESYLIIIENLQNE